MKRRLANFVTLLSLLLCVYAVAASFIAVREGGPYLRGYDVFQPLEPPRAFTAADFNSYRPPAPTFSFAGFRVQRGFRAQYTIQHGRVYTIPFWSLSLVFAVSPLAWLRARGRERRLTRRTRMWEAGICPTCRYDLRATPGRCPECGKVASATGGCA